MKKIDYAAVEFEAIAQAVAAKMAYGAEIAPGDRTQWECRFGDEGPGSWTRGEAVVQQAHITRAREIAAAGWGA